MTANRALKPLAILYGAILAAALGTGCAFAAEPRLVSVVIVSRHGVRSPIAKHPPLASIAAEAWPSWRAPPGHLTQRGAELATLLGAFYRDYYAARGLFPARGCPPASAVFAWADADQRTRATARSLLDGMFPGCNVKLGYRVGAKADPLFHPLRAGLCHIDRTRGRMSVLRRAGGSLRALQARFRGQLTAMQSILKCCRPTLCRAAGAAAKCTLPDVPGRVAYQAGSMRLSGPIAIASTAAEVFLLEYAEGFPKDRVAWGRASTPQAMRPLLRLHTLQLDLLHRTPYLAARQGSALAERILSALRRSIRPGASAAPKLTLFVGHDTNLFDIGGVLGLHWSLPSYLRDQTPPAGALHFQLLRERRSGAYAVRIVYVAQTLAQMRRLGALDPTHPPERAIATIDKCPGNRRGMCPWPAFAAMASRAIDRACIGRQ